MSCGGGRRFDRPPDARRADRAQLGVAAQERAVPALAVAKQLGRPSAPPDVRTVRVRPSASSRIHQHFPALTAQQLTTSWLQRSSPCSTPRPRASTRRCGRRRGRPRPGRRRRPPPPPAAPPAAAGCPRCRAAGLLDSAPAACCGVPGGSTQRWVQGGKGSECQAGSMVRHVKLTSGCACACQSQEQGRAGKQ
jgi:hypothetical protein